MAAPIRNRPEFVRALEGIRLRPPAQRPNLLGFFLFDERLSHQVVLEFARREFQWLDRLATANRMILFLFLPEGEAVRYADTNQLIEVAEGTGPIANPSLHVAAQFGLGPSTLPGVVFFTQTDLEEYGAHQGVYSPLPLELFGGDARAAEEAFSRLFGIVQEAHFEAAGPDLLLPILERKLAADRQPEPRVPGAFELRVGELKPVVFNGLLSEVASLAFATGLGG